MCLAVLVLYHWSFLPCLQSADPFSLCQRMRSVNNSSSCLLVEHVMSFFCVKSVTSCRAVSRHLFRFRTFTKRLLPGDCLVCVVRGRVTLLVWSLILRYRCYGFDVWEGRIFGPWRCLTLFPITSGCENWGLSASM
jgi:hypothetical protein